MLKYIYTSEVSNTSFGHTKLHTGSYHLDTLPSQTLIILKKYFISN